MKLTIKQHDLHAAATTAARIVAKSPQLPILANVAFRASRKEVELTSSDLSVWFSARVPAEIEEEGSALIDARRLADIAKNAAGETIVFEGEPLALAIKSGKTRYKIVGLADSAFPKTPEVSEKGQSYPAALLRHVLESVACAMSEDSTRAHLNGALLALGDGALQAVATDGHRLATRGEVPENAPQAFIPAPGVHHLLRGLPKGGDVYVSTSRNPDILHVLGESEDFSVRLLDAQFPPWRMILPKNSRGSIRVEKDALLGALSRVAPLADGKNDGVQLVGREGALVLSARSFDGHEAEEEVETTHLRGEEEFKLSLSARYLADACGACVGSFEASYGASDLDPIDIRSEDYRGIIMPMRL